MLCFASLRALAYSLHEVLVLGGARGSEELVAGRLMVHLVHHVDLRLGAREGLLLAAFEDLHLLWLRGVHV